MKKILLILALLFPITSFAQVNVNQGGTGTTTFPTNWVLTGNSSLRLTATTTLNLANINANTSAGLNFHSNNGTDIAIFGAGGGANATFYGGVNINGNLLGTNATTTNFFSTNASTTNATSTNVFISKSLGVNTVNSNTEGILSKGYSFIANTVGLAAPDLHTDGSTLYYEANSTGAHYFRNGGYGGGNMFIIQNGGGIVNGSFAASSLNAPTGGFITPGQTGIGTSSPWGILSVSSANNTISKPLFVIATSSSAVATATPFIVSNNGKVGIGTNAPTNDLDVRGQTNTTVNIDATTAGSLNYSLNGVAKAYTGYGPDGYGFGHPTGLFFATPAGETINFSSVANSVPWVTMVGGNLGIGTSSPFARLSVAMSSTTPSLVVGVAGSSTPSLYVGSANANGYVGVGTVAPLQSLHVYSPTTYNGIFINGNVAPSVSFANTNNTTAAWKVGLSGNNAANFAISSGSAASDRVVVDSNGLVGIASTTPWGLLSINPNGITGPAFAIGSSTKTDFVVANSGRAGFGDQANTVDTLFVKSNSLGGGLSVANQSSGTGGMRMSYDGGTGGFYLDNLFNSTAGSFFFRTQNNTLTPLSVKGNGTVGIASTTFSGQLGIGPATANGSTTISTGKIQYDTYNSAGTRSCAYIVGTAWVIQPGACN